MRDVLPLLNGPATPTSLPCTHTECNY